MDSEYRRIEESAEDPRQKAEYWETAKGLQAVDGLKTSDYLDEVEKKHVGGEYTAQDAVRVVEEHYREKREEAGGSEAEEAEEAEEADIVSARIVRLLMSGAFSYRPTMLGFIHGQLFEGLIDAPYDKSYRDWNVNKAEAVLAGESVSYAPFQLIRENLDYDFGMFDYAGFAMAGNELGSHGKALVRFVSNVWQTHPFVEGNTRTVAVFTEMLLRTKGARVGNEMFEKHAKYFRNALVRANYAALRDDVPEDDTFLVMFFENLLAGRSHDLRNRDLYCVRLYQLKGMDLPF